jgi:hypothetical protein
MTVHSWLRSLFTRRGTRTLRKAPKRVRLVVEELEARLTPTGVTWFGGPVLPNVEIEPIYYSSFVNSQLTAGMPGFLNALVSSPFIPTVIGEYSTYGLSASVNGDTIIGNQVFGYGSVGTGDVGVPAVGGDGNTATVTDAQIQTFIRKHRSGHCQLALCCVYAGKRYGDLRWRGKRRKLRCLP